MVDLEKLARQEAEAREALERGKKDARDAVLGPLSKLSDMDFLALDPEDLFNVVALLAAKHAPLLAVVASPEARVVIERFREKNGQLKTARRSARPRTARGKSIDSAASTQTRTGEGRDEQSGKGFEGE